VANAYFVNWQVARGPILFLEWEWVGFVEAPTRMIVEFEANLSLHCARQDLQ